MENAVQITVATPETLLPDDLREWIDDHTLARLVFAAVNAAGLPLANQETPGGASLAPHLAMGLLTYCYACAIYRSSDVELSSIQDTMVRHLCADHYPDAGLLRCFRRYHRQSMRATLTEVLQRAWQLHAGLEESDPDAGVLSTSPSSRQRAEPEDVLHFANAAEERINCAARLDCWAADY